MYKQVIRKLTEKQDLNSFEAEAIMDQIMGAELTPAQIGAFLGALSSKGESKEEIVGFAKAMRNKSRKVHVEGTLLDTCGTGGSSLPKINVSTLSAFILAAGGVKVAKHGSRSNTGKCGSMDVLEKLGVRIDLEPEEVETLLESEGISFMFAPRFHPAMAHVGTIRRELGFRTVFNFLGPLANPAGAQRQILGVSNRERAPLMIEALKELGTERALVMNGSDGLDELTITGTTNFWELRDGMIEKSVFDPRDIGIRFVPFERIAGGEKEANAELFELILEDRGEEKFSALRNFTLLNAATGFWIANRTADIKQGYRLAEEVLSSQEALRKYQSYRAASIRLAQKAGN